MSELKSKSEKFLEKRAGIIHSATENSSIGKIIPQVSPLMSKSVSSYRRETLSNEIKKGLFKDGSGNNEDDITTNSIVTSSIGIKKTAQVTSNYGNYRGGMGDSVKQSPEVYSPLWLNSNLSLPRDRPTINAWCRSFYALNPFVHNAISLHSTYPISKLNIKCPNKDIEKFFNDMIEEIDLMNICVQIAQEYWLLGESFVYSELDESRGKWNRLLIQNPDYILIKRTIVANEPLIMLHPDENLKKIIFSNKPSDMEQRKKLNKYIVDSVKRGDNIILDNFNVSHLARRISPYEIRGTGLPVCVFRQLMLFDKLKESKFAQADNMINPLTLIKIGSADFKPTMADLESWRNIFECYDKETEVLTEDGFKKFDEVISYEENDGIISNVMPKNIKIACFDSNSKQLEYHHPSAASLYNYDGDMYHFNNEKIDIKVTPNHDMYVSKKEYEYHNHRDLRKTVWSDWCKIKAQDLKLTDYSRFCSKINWIGNEIEYVNVLDKKVPVELYLEFLGYLISEGCLYTDDENTYITNICQTYKKYQKDMFDCINKFSSHINKSVRHANTKTDLENNIWSGSFNNKELFFYFKNELQNSEGKVKCYNKQIPKWIKNLSPRLLNILLTSLVKGDGSVYDNNKSNRFAYYTTSKQLADDVYEIIYKCGHVPTMFIRDSEKYIDGYRRPLYILLWSNSGKGDFPLVYKTSRNSQTKEKHNLLNIKKYNGKVWCFTVPTGLFVTRRNGKITIQGNSAQYDKDFKVFTHEGVDVQKIGSGAGIYDISGDITQIVKEIYIGLQIPSVLMDGGADVTYANGGVALDVLRQRYMQFRNMMSSWLRRKIFAPISKIQGFYEYKNKEKQLIVPDIDWNHMSIFDAGDYINNLLTLTQGEDAQKRVSLHSLYRSIGLEYEDEVRKMRKEAIQNAISKKEKAALESMDLNSLRSLNEEDEIVEQDNTNEQGAGSLPGETPGGGLPGLGESPPTLPGLPESLPSTPPPTPPATP
jgi:hypothetical protein